MSTTTMMTSRPERGSSCGAEAFAGTGTLVRFILRRDRVRIPVWIAAIVGSLAGVAQSYSDTYPTQADLDSRSELADNPIFIAFNGPGYGLDNYTFGAMVANESLYIAVILVALMSTFLVIRHTRAEEESGRAELVRSGVVGRHAATASTLLVVAALNLVVGLLTAAALSSLDRLDGAGSLTYAMSMAAAGLVFMAVATMAAQVTEYARGAVGVGVAVLGATYLVRAVGDVSETGLSWVSPFAWSLETRAFVDERWWPLLLSLALTIVLVTGAMALSVRRDVGAGLVPPRPGPPLASNWLVHPLGLAFRLQRAGLVAWAVGLAVLGAAFGPMVEDVEEFAADNEQVQEIFVRAGDTTFVESFLSTVTAMMALIATGFAIQSALRVRAEEISGRAEPLLTTALTRTRWGAGYLVVAMAGSAMVMLTGSLALGVTASVTQADTSLWLELFAGGLVQVPAMWVVIGVAFALFGLAPRLAQAAWLLLAYGVVVDLMGPALGMPDVAHNLSPFGHVPRIPGDAFTATPMLILMVLAAALLSAGLAGFRRRDVHTT
ncbi:ABC transporter permease [Phytoactinopolyspora mesophila]|uniref:ABC transporter permease n=1 Tax=Phytoactinopolyspora mesophila TaxID=2650750 RepID=A0A7K3M9N3_9ACTN|nr:ABC transporter permease [Phytoactinopolyspora mesophila]NDL60035.1 ABC transporter permease [Phytoactinopolyspora mesophila]